VNSSENPHPQRRKGPEVRKKDENRGRVGLQEGSLGKNRSGGRGKAGGKNRRIRMRTGRRPSKLLRTGRKNPSSRREAITHFIKKYENQGKSEKKDLLVECVAKTPREKSGRYLKGNWNEECLRRRRVNVLTEQTPIGTFTEKEKISEHARKNSRMRRGGGLPGRVS